jgi:DNA-binding beta-propeller fold protein YncE
MSSEKLYILQYRPGGEIIELDPDGGNRRTLLGNLLDNVDGIVIDKRTSTLYWTNMGPAIGPREGEFFQADGSIECIGLNGANRRMLVGHGLTVTPKQVAADFDAGFLYWCDREGMRVMRSKLDGSNVTVLVRNGVFPADSHDVMRHCVGVAVDPGNRYIYWTQKGSPDGGKGRIFRAGLELPGDQQPENRTDIELLIDHLPEPIDLELDTKNNFLYWTDRGNLDGGNSLNRARIGSKQLENHEVLATGMQEGIGLAIDHANRRAFTTELGGEVRVAPLEANAHFTTIAKLGILTGIAYVA